MIIYQGSKRRFKNKYDGTMIVHKKNEYGVHLMITSTFNRIQPLVIFLITSIISICRKYSSNTFSYFSVMVLQLNMNQPHLHLYL